MPPKPKFTKDEIVAAALNIVSRKGIDGLTAKSLGNELGSSARPIFTVFSGMGEVQEQVRTAAMAKFEHFSVGEFPNMPLFKQIGMKMVLFGVREPKLYQFLFMRENADATSFDDVFGELGATAKLCIQVIEKDYALDPESARILFENVWIYTFGIGALCATGVCTFSEETLGKMLTTQFQAMMRLVHPEVQ